MSGVAGEYALDLSGVDVVAIGDDHVLEPVNDAHVPGGFEAGDVASVQPAVRVERPRGLGRGCCSTRASPPARAPATRRGTRAAPRAPAVSRSAILTCIPGRERPAAPGRGAVCRVCVSPSPDISVIPHSSSRGRHCTCCHRSIGRLRHGLPAHREATAAAGRPADAPSSLPATVSRKVASAYWTVPEPFAVKGPPVLGQASWHRPYKRFEFQVGASSGYRFSGFRWTAWKARTVTGRGRASFCNYQGCTKATRARIKLKNRVIIRCGDSTEGVGIYTRYEFRHAGHDGTYRSVTGC